ncbi:carbohydrate esterase family 1 protein [Patellaria atrata CBS 101060]|uniref:Carboxylic ester hydrolase n=1 Tax=Patellaria atrata CBS 101060 TaxID=1346257 RepID=A0A9P4VNQ4_9PEZI|nr:carbohydrate esterase family 1 protein [Patellaria atrata CBS 101060]
MVRFSVSATLALLATVVVATPIDPVNIWKRQSRGSLQQVSNYNNTGSANVPFYIYVPNKQVTSPGIVVAVHYCTGTAQAYFSGSPYRQLAEQYGFIVIYPSSPHSGTCWDVSSKATLTHNGGGDSNAIANMVKWTIGKYTADPEKVFVTGTSSGAMMTNVLAATYPDIFKAGTVYSGVPAGGFYSTSGGVAAWNSSSANGQINSTPAIWGGMVRSMYPGYEGERPKMQIYHGTADSTLRTQNYYETCKQWADVFGYDYNAPATKTSNSPLSGYTRTTWGDKLQGILANNVGHSVPIQGNEDMKFFGFV